MTVADTIPEMLARVDEGCLRRDLFHLSQASLAAVARVVEGTE